MMPTESLKILERLITDDANWKWEGKGKTRTPKGININSIVYKYFRQWEYHWVITIWLDFDHRFVHLFRAIKTGHPAYKDEEYAKDHFAYATVNGQDTLYLNCDFCLWEMQVRFNARFIPWWLECHFDEWGVLTEEEISAWLEEIKPPVPGDYQFELF